MSMTYTGHGTEEQVIIGIIGDGVATTCTVDLSKSPFDLSLGNMPIGWGMYVQDGPTPTVSQNGKVFTFTYPSPLPGPTSSSGYSPRSQLQMFLFYPG